MQNNAVDQEQFAAISTLFPEDCKIAFTDRMRVVFPVARGPKRKNEFMASSGASCSCRFTSISHSYCGLSG